MDSSFTEHVLERARQRQKKLVPLREANFTTSHSNPNISDSILTKKSRKEILSEPTLHLTNSPKMSRQNSKTTISSNVPGSPNPEVNTLNIQKDTFNMEIKFSSVDNVRVEVEIDTDSDGNSENINFSKNTLSDESEDGGNKTAVLRDCAKDRLQRLGKLYGGNEDLSSPIHRTEGNFIIEDNKVNQKENDVKVANKPRKGLGKLAALANDINQWEDEITHSKKSIAEQKCTTPKKSWKPPAPQPPKAAISPSKPIHKTKPPAPKPPTSPENCQISTKHQTSKQNLVSEKKKATPKQLKWDKTVLDTLESQGFTRTESNSRLVYNFKHSQKPTDDDEQIDEESEAAAIQEEYVTKQFVPLKVQKEEEKVTPRSPLKNKSIANRAALFESVKAMSPVKKEKDPALLSVSERKALFEKNRGEALVPKSAFGMSAPVKSIPTSSSTPNNLNEAAGSKNVSEKSCSVAEKIRQLNTNKSTISQAQIENKIKVERQKEMEVLANRFHQNKKVAEEIETDSSDDEHEVSETTAMIATRAAKIMSKSNITSPPPPPLPPQDSRKSGEKRASLGDSAQVQAILGEVKRIKVKQPKDGQLYPCLSDIEGATETETDHTVTPSPNNSMLEDSFCGSEANTSFGKEILQAVCKNRSPQKMIINDSTDSDVSDALEDMNDCLNEYEDDTDSAGPTPPKHGKISSPKKCSYMEPSESFKYSSPSKFKSPCKVMSPKKTSHELPTHVVEGADLIPLTYTVSFYRKQQTQSGTPIRQITRQAIVEEEETESGESLAVAEKITQLNEEINKQQMVISQTSRALNLCNSTPEFIGSTEQVEAEKVLLLASHRRQASTNEIQRLKVEGSLRPLGPHKVPLEKGSLCISNITVPLKKEYIRALAAAGGKGHHVVCLIKSGEQVVSTSLVSTVASSSKNPELELKIPGQVKLKNIYSDFTVTFEVYCLQAQEEILPHEVKYHIGKKNNNKSTPKKSKNDSRMVRPPKESPGGPQAVRTSTFALNGYVIFSIQAINKTTWTLNKIPPISPLEGSIAMRVHCELDVSVEHKGFLNMFEDISGLGAWHRRWCLLKGNTISYWKYPEDERKKAPIDTIDLRSCFTKIVGPVSRDICARLNTFLLERERPIQQNDKETLTVTCLKEKTIIKHLLSADSKEERIEWCENLNKALTAIRMWGSKV